MAFLIGMYGCSVGGPGQNLANRLRSHRALARFIKEEILLREEVRTKK